MTTKVLETKSVKVQASPIKTNGLTPLKIYNATRETIEYTTINSASAAGAVSWKTEEKSIGHTYTVINDNNKTQRFGSEFFREV